MKYCVTLILLIVLAIPAFSQQLITVKGTVKNAEGKALPKASVILYYKGSKDSLKTLTADNGDFSFNAVKPTSIGIQVSYVGYSAFMNAYDFSGTSGIQQATGIVLIPGNNTLENVTLESSKIQIKEDTVSYVVDSTMYRKNDNVEEVLKKLPGVQVDKDGTVTAQGKQVTKVKVNGKEFFGGDVTTATRELNADMVDKIQIIDDYGDQSAFTGIKDGDPSKTLNIQLKKDRNKGYFGNLTAGAGTEDRYVTSLSVNKFNNNQQISILGNLNNTNASLFNFGSIGGSMGNMISSMARGMGIGQGGGGVASALGNLGASDGIGTTKSIGLNYRDEWGKKVSVYGSYSFSEKGTSTLKDITQQNSFQNLTNINTRKQDDYTVADNHRFSFNLEYKIDSFNYLKVNPSVTYRKSATRFVSTSNITDAKQNLL
ncbi:MAG TPA: carboxypeptidase-like regulatory domain-containing protein, partial [Ferruginibacter sp.]|nr:carboxypeptidase-like regulatory domain-containing protein [Ferruginibacter sp.]